VKRGYWVLVGLWVLVLIGVVARYEGHVSGWLQLWAVVALVTLWLGIMRRVRAS